jgi:hypothetical protein
MKRMAKMKKIVGNGTHSEEKECTKQPPQQEIIYNYQLLLEDSWEIMNNFIERMSLKIDSLHLPD